MNPMRRQEIILFLVSIAVVIVAWISFNIYHNSVSSTIPDALNTQIIPIQSSFDTKTLDNLKERKKVIPDLEVQVATTSPTPTLQATLSGELNP